MYHALFMLWNMLLQDALWFSCSDSADKVVQGQGKFEEIVVASNEITASTVQLVSETKKHCLTKVHNQVKSDLFTSDCESWFA